MGLLSRLRRVLGLSKCLQLPRPTNFPRSAVAAHHPCWHQACIHAGEAVAEDCVFQELTLLVYDGERCSMLEKGELDGETAVFAMVGAFVSLASADAMGDADSL